MFQGQLFDKQREGAEFLASKRRAGLFWEQGTGKTVISIAVNEKLKELNKVNTAALVLSPASLCWQFGLRIEEFTDATAQVTNHNRKKTRQYDSEAGTIDYFVVPYGIFLNDFDDIVDHRWDVVIADEAEAFSNNKSKTYQSLLKFNRIQDPTYRFALTGTAVSNKLEELYAIMYWVDKLFLPPWPEFEKAHIKRRKHKKIRPIIGYKNLKPLNEYLKHKVDRKTAKDMKGHIPELTTQEVTLEKDDEYINAEHQLLEALDTFAADLILKGDEPRFSQFDAEISRSLHRARRALISQSKIQKCVDEIRRHLDQDKDYRAVVFCFYKEPLERLEAELGLQGVSGNTWKFTGDETAEQKQEAIHNTRNSRGVLLCSNAGARGLDLPFINLAIHLDIPLSWGVFDQRNKRTARASSKFATVVAKLLIVEDSIDEFFYYLVKNKGKLAEATLESGEDEVIVKPETLRKFIHGTPPT